MENKDNEISEVTADNIDETVNEAETAADAAVSEPETPSEEQKETAEEQAVEISAETDAGGTESGSEENIEELSGSEGESAEVCEDGTVENEPENAAEEVPGEPAETAEEKPDDSADEQAETETEPAAEEPAETSEEPAEAVIEEIPAEIEPAAEKPEESLDEAAGETAEQAAEEESAEESSSANEEPAEDLNAEEAVQEEAVPAEETLPGTAEEPEALPVAAVQEEKAVIPAAPVEKQKKGGLLSNKKVLTGAAAALLVIALAFIIPAWQKSQKYKQAIEKLNAGEYQEAIELFAELPEYKDSDQYALYTGGLKAFYEGDLEEAKEKFDNSMEIEDAALYASYINGVNSMEEGFSTESYENAYSAFIGAGGLLDSSELAVYTRGVADFLSGDTAAADTAFRKVVDDNAIPAEYVGNAENAVWYMDTIEKFDSGDYSVKDDFEEIYYNDDGMIGYEPMAYVNYIEGKEFYDDGHYYKARAKFMDCPGIKDADELYDSCVQERPSTGIMYDKNKSSAVSIIIEDREDGNDLYVKIYNSSDKLVETLYIRDGKKGTAKIAAGKHRMALGSGDGNEWYGTKDMFGDDGSYRRLLIDNNGDFYNFQNNYEYTLRLDVSTDGNVASQYTDYEGL